MYIVHTLYLLLNNKVAGSPGKLFFCADDDENISSSRVDRPAEIGECIIQLQYDENYYLLLFKIIIYSSK